MSLVLTEVQNHGGAMHVESRPRKAPRAFLGYFTGAALLGYALSIFYSALSAWISPGWLVIAAFHSLLAWLIYLKKPLLVPSKSLWAFAPAAAVLSGSIGLSLASRLLIAEAPELASPWDLSSLAFVLWIPLVEECVFRLGVGGFFRQRLGPFWGAYASALIFAMAHSGTGWALPSVALGPFLLALLCEGLYVRTGRLAAIVSLHAACNASAIVFASLDARWLDWLQGLYLRV